MTTPKTIPGGDPANPKTRAAQDREKRRAEALKANLRRRKAQTRARTGVAAKKSDASGGKSK